MIDRIFRVALDITIVILFVYVAMNIIALIIMGSMLISSLPHSYCMCHIDWGDGEFTKIFKEFKGYGGYIVYTRPEICGAIC